MKTIHLFNASGCHTYGLVFRVHIIYVDSNSYSVLQMQGWTYSVLQMQGWTVRSCAACMQQVFIATENSKARLLDMV